MWVGGWRLTGQGLRGGLLSDGEGCGGDRESGVDGW